MDYCNEDINHVIYVATSYNFKFFYLYRINVLISYCSIVIKVISFILHSHNIILDDLISCFYLVCCIQPPKLLQEKIQNSSSQLLTPPSTS